MKLVALASLALALLAVECALLRPLGFSIARADVGVVMVLFFALRCSALEGALGSAAVGYFVDVLSGQPSGLYVFTAVLTFLLSKFIAPLAEIRSAPAFAILTGGMDMLHNLTAFILIRISSAEGIYYTAMIYAIPASGALTSLTALAMWPLLKKIDSRFKKPDIEILRPKKPKEGRQTWRSRRTWAK